MPSKRFKEAKTKIDPLQQYDIAEAVKLVKEASTEKFDASVEIHCRLGIDPKQSDQQVRGTLTLPHATGKSKKVAAFVSADKEAEAKAAGADIIGSQEVIDAIVQKGTIDFDVAVATPDMMPKLAKAAKVLGPRGLMPNPKEDTVGTNVEKMVKEQKAGKLAFKNDATGNIHSVIGRVSLTEEQLNENFEAFMTTLKKMRPASTKGIFVKNCSISSAMGPGVKISV